MENMKHIFGQVRAFDRAKAEETRQVEFVISDESRDRHGTIIPVNNWKLDNFNNNGIVGYQHDVYGDGFFSKPDPDDVLGRGEAFIDNGQLIGRVTFEPADINPKAEKIFQKVLHGTLKATSVGFIEKSKGKYGEKDQARGEANQTYYFGDVELLEFSIVNIPSNANALRRNANETKIEELETKIKELEEENNRLTAKNTDLEIRIASLNQNLRIAKLNGLQRAK